MPTKILLIEDNQDHVLFTKRILKNVNEGYLLDSVSQTKDGLKKITEEDYNLILCDYRLPDASALDVLKQVRQSGQDLPFIVVTSSGSEKIAVELMKEGAYDYVVKDSSYEDNLPIVIRRAIDIYNAKKEKERLEKELINSNERLKEMYAIKSDFTSMVSHELRTPLTAIKEGISVVLEGLAGPINAQQREFLDIAKNNVDRLHRLINDVLDFSKLESKRLVFKMQKNDINKIVNEAAGVQRPIAEAKCLYLKTELCLKIPKIEFDADRINQVLSNLINNAIKFTVTGGIIVSASKDDKEETVIVCVKDTGEGIRKEDMPKLFQKFQQLTRGNQDNAGTGLGLAICKEIVEQHGGKIWVESEYGKGCEFKLTLPLEHIYRILVIDDEEIILDTCEQILKKNRYFVLRTQEGIKGIQIAQNDKPDLILLDMRLKDTSGYEVIGRIRSNKETQDIPILAITGYKEEAEKIESQKEKLALPWLSKPFETEEFLSKVKSSLRPLSLTKN
ncbi:MAG: response regulator [Candidatus Omnitrophota bacterium]